MSKPLKGGLLRFPDVDEPLFVDWKKKITLRRCVTFAQRQHTLLNKGESMRGEGTLKRKWVHNWEECREKSKTLKN